MYEANACCDIIIRVFEIVDGNPGFSEQIRVYKKNYCEETAKQNDELITYDIMRITGQFLICDLCLCLHAI